MNTDAEGAPRPRRSTATRPAPRHAASPPAEALVRLEWVVQRVSRALQRAVDLVAADHGVTAAEYHLLLAVSDDVGRSNAEIARLTFVTPQSANNVLAELERRGFLSRRDDPHHGRKRQTVLTAPGREVLDSCTRQIAAIEDRVVAALDDEQRRVLLPALWQAAEALAGGYFGDAAEEARAEELRRTRHAPARRTPAT